MQGWLQRKKLIRIIRVVAPHILIFVAVGAYILLGGVIFMYLEATTPWSTVEVNSTVTSSTHAPTVNVVDKPNQCNDESLEIILEALYEGCCSVVGQTSKECYDAIKEELFQCVKYIRAAGQPQAKKDWDYYSAVVLAFTIVTTIGYGHIAPSNTASRLFCVFYGLLGIPLTLLAIADHGRFLSSALQFAFGKCKRIVARLRDVEGNASSGDNESAEANDTLSPMLLLILYSGYLLFGSLLLVKWEADWSFADAFYFSFISLSTIGFGDVVPTNHYYLAWVLLYIGTGLALSSTAVDILAEYLKTLHQFGKKIRNVTHAKIWFGGKMLTVKDLVSTVGKYFGATEDALSHLVQNLDAVVNHVIVEKETGVVHEPLISPFINKQLTPRQPPPPEANSTPKAPSTYKAKTVEKPRNFQNEADFIDDE